MVSPTPSIALAITSHEQPESLAAVLRSVSAQRVSPDEIVIADDGSGHATQEVMQSFIAASRVPVRRVSQPHQGFRVARLRNLAIAATHCELILFVDGDMLLHPAFVADHARHARRGFYTQGVRALADASLSARLLAGAPFPGPASAGLGGLRRAYLLHAPAATGALRRVANGFIAVKSCNQAIWRDDLVRVNGFDEDFIGWGPEDKELCARLENADVGRQSLLFGGIACHLHHAPASRASLSANLARLSATRASGRTRAEHGLDSHLRD